MSSSRRFAAGMVTGALAFALVLFVPTILVDPTTYISNLWPGKPQLCAPGIRVEPRVGKPLALAAVRPHEVLIGNSRVAQGFSEHSTKDQIGGSVMNLGIPGASLDEIEVVFDEVLHSGRVRRIWVGIDYGMFEQGKQQLLQTTNRSPLTRLNAAITNPEAIGMSYAALFGHRCQLAEISENGFTELPQDSAPTPEEWDRTIALSSLKMERAFAAMAGSNPQQRAALQQSRRAALERMVDRAQQANVAVVLFAGPLSREHIEAIRRAGLETDFRRWRSEVERFGTQQGTPVFDFSDYQATQAESLAACNPANNASCSMYDVSHYKPTVGAHMLSVMRQSLDTAKPQFSLLH